VSAVTTTPVRIAGIFYPGSATSATNLVSQLEHQAAFLMAINEINDKTDGMYDDILPGVTLSYYITGSSSLTTASSNFLAIPTAFGSSNPVTAVVTAGSTANALVTSQFATKLQLPQILSSASSGMFQQHSVYPYVSFTTALISQQGMVIQNVMCLFAKRIVLFVATDDESLQQMNSFEDNAACELDILAKLVVRAGSTDYSEQIAELWAEA
jgi:hypothetical protein